MITAVSGNELSQSGQRLERGKALLFRVAVFMLRHHQIQYQNIRMVFFQQLEKVIASVPLGDEFDPVPVSQETANGFMNEGVIVNRNNFDSVHGLSNSQQGISLPRMIGDV
jgi:hypothetical protein